MRREAKTMLYLDDDRGIYIPRDFAADTNRECISGVDAADLDTLALGPGGSEHYWDIWADICDHAIVTDEDGTRYRLHQDGALFLIEYGAERDETTDEYFFEDGTADDEVQS